MELVWYHFRLSWADGGTSCYGKNGLCAWDAVEPWQLTVYDDTHKTPAWFGRGVTYQIFPDRFRRAKSRDVAGLVGPRTLHENWDELPEYRPNAEGEITCSDFFGGDLQGITEKLDYLASLGVTTLYLCPIFEASTNHRYDTACYERIDPLLGDEADFRTLCAEAKKRGIYVMLDGVFNHTGRKSVYFNADSFYDDLNVKLVRPAGDMLGLHSEFLPASKRYINDYVQYVKSDFLAGLGFGATQQLGETTGIYMGYSVDTGRNVYLQPSLASQGVKGTVTNALASAFVGSLGGGKSFCNNLLVYYAVLFGGQALLLDPKSERGNWKETLPEIAHEINIVNLTSDKDNAGLLDPFVIMKNVKDAESLAIDILTFLTGISSRDGEKFPVLRKAVRSVTQSDSRGLLHVIDELRREDTPISRNIADHIDSFTDYDFAHLLFSDGTVENAISLDNQLNIIQVADLVLPDKDTTFEEYTTIELLSVSMLIVISTFALDFIHSDRSIFKIVDLDEAWAFLNVAQGETLSNKLVRAGRAMQAGVYFVTQSAYDVSKESLKNNIGLKFAFRSTDINEIKQTLEFFGIDKDDENNQKRLRDLENGQCLLQDLYGRVGVVQIHPVFEELLHAFDTRPPVQRNEVE